MSIGTQSTPEVNISPKKIRAKKGTFQVTIPNREKQAHRYQLKASDPEGMCNYNFDKENITVAPGYTETVTLTVAFKKVHLTGTPKVCNFTVAATGTAGEIKTAAGQLECPAILPLWVLATGALAVVAIIAVVVIMLANGNKGGSTALTTTNTNKTANSATTPQSTTLTTSPSTLVTSTTTHMTTAQISSTTTAVASTPMTTATTTTTSTAAATTTPTSSASTPPDLNGSWNFTITVTQANGVCAGEGGTSTKTMTITQKGQNITIAGFLGNPANQLTGTIDLESGIWVINVSGSYSEDGGTTTSSHRLEVKNTSEISGTEDWSWSGGGGTCPGGKASVTATRI